MPIFSKPPFRFRDKKKDMPEGLWIKCNSCDAVIHELESKSTQRVCAKCNHHFHFPSEDRVTSVVDPDSFEEMDADMATVDALEFKGYPEKVEKNRKATNLKEAVVTGRATIDEHPVGLGVMDFRFFAGSMGSVVGEKITRLVEASTKEKRSVILFSASGGARMQEGILSLMQMAKTSGALARHSEARLPFISILTHPTTGGVTASFATLGDVILAEPGCMIGFAGPRVVKETTHQNLPPGFQTAEFMLEHGLVDRIVPRKDMRATLTQLLGYLNSGKKLG
ncbi:MAG: acetyl-CoA carboxylase, carboxyltransferase subunit beta [Verrucomicrobiota bacterium]